MTEELLIDMLKDCLEGVEHTAYIENALEGLDDSILVYKEEKRWINLLID